jgi:hypothetical protein
MAGFKSDGGVSFGGSGGTDIFVLKSSTGTELKTYQVPVDQADAFQEKMKVEEVELRKSLGEVDPLRLIKISRCF